MMLVLVKAKAMPLLMMLMVLMVVHFQSMFFSSFCSSCPSSWPSFGSEKYYLLPLQRKKCRGLIEPISFSCSVWTLFWCVCVCFDANLNQTRTSTAFYHHYHHHHRHESCHYRNQSSIENYYCTSATSTFFTHSLQACTSRSAATTIFRSRHERRHQGYLYVQYAMYHINVLRRKKKSMLIFILIALPFCCASNSL